MALKRSRSLLVGRSKKIIYSPRNIGWFIWFLFFCLVSICQRSLFIFCEVQGLTMNKSTIRTNRRSTGKYHLSSTYQTPSICMGFGFFILYFVLVVSSYWLYSTRVSFDFVINFPFSVFQAHIYSPVFIWSTSTALRITRVHWQNNMGLNKLWGEMLQRESLNEHGFFSIHFLSNTWCRWWFVFFFVVALSVDYVHL